MNEGISGYNGRIHPYRQMEQRSETAPPRPNSALPPDEPSRIAAPSYGADLSESESKMIHQNFPPTEQMTLRLYGPGSGTETVSPNGIGRRLDVRG